MNNRILNWLKNPYALLIWALVSGCAYLSIIAQFVIKFTEVPQSGSLLIWFFFPVIICGTALLLVKAVKQAFEEENHKLILTIFYTHLSIIAMGIVFFAAMFI